MGEPPVDGATVREFLRRAEADSDALVIEGIGGVMAPLDRENLWIDLHAEFGWPAFVIGRGGLGTLSHTFLTIEALRRREIPVVGFAFGAGATVLDSGTTSRFTGVGAASPGAVARAAAEENARMVEERTGVECLGVVAYDPLAPAAAWASGVNWSRLEGRLG
jgi:hypothetical protein